MVFYWKIPPPWSHTAVIKRSRIITRDSGIMAVVRRSIHPEMSVLIPYSVRGIQVREATLLAMTSVHVVAIREHTGHPGVSCRTAVPIPIGDSPGLKHLMWWPNHIPQSYPPYMWGVLQRAEELSSQYILCQCSDLELYAFGLHLNRENNSKDLSCHGRMQLRVAMPDWLWLGYDD